MNHPLVLIEKEGPAITVLTLQRPDRRNALTIGLMEELCAAVQAAARDSTQRVLILKGAGTAFCAGLDLNEAAEPSKAHSSAEMVAQTLLTLSQTPLMTIAAVHGAAVAGGAGLMSTCDFVIAAHGTKIGYPEVRRGLVAGLVMTFLRRQLKERDIRELLLMGDLITAEHALQIGLVNRVVAEKEILKEAYQMAEVILQGAPGAQANTKKLLGQLWASAVEEDLKQALDFHMQARNSDEAKEGIAAFLEKRPPRWAV